MQNSERVNEMEKQPGNVFSKAEKWRLYILQLHPSLVHSLKISFSVYVYFPNIKFIIWIENVYILWFLWNFKEKEKVKCEIRADLHYV